MLYQKGVQSEIDGSEVGGKFEFGGLGFTLNYHVSSNAAIRTSYSSNLFGDDNLNTSFIRILFAYMWNRTAENDKKLRQGN